jgi:HNH endonuclease
VTIGSRGPWRRRGAAVRAAKAPRRRRSSSLRMPLGFYLGLLLIGGALAWFVVHPLISVPLTLASIAAITIYKFTTRAATGTSSPAQISSGESSLPTENQGFKREPIPAGLRWQVFQRDHFTCVYCGRRGTDAGVILHIDHRVPVARGGGSRIDNLCTACQDCNLGKSARAL